MSSLLQHVIACPDAIRGPSTLVCPRSPATRVAAELCELHSAQRRLFCSLLSSRRLASSPTVPPPPEHVERRPTFLLAPLRATFILSHAPPCLCRGAGYIIIRSLPRLRGRACAVPDPLQLLELRMFLLSIATSVVCHISRVFPIASPVQRNFLPFFILSRDLAVVAS